MTAPYSILVVEDSSAARAYVRASLEQDSTIEVAEAPSGFEALRLLAQSDFDLVLVDINMPDINGLELVAFMRGSARHKDTPLIIISTEASPRDRERGISLGADEYIAKPFAPDALQTAIAKLRNKARTPGD